ncbi:hypothetical protein AAF712_006242 [Marasmius tenuissimus]|uniref:Uncharacterized protein n=1 Tax=Marasmius tenuissimus TaxID=585030 RepID=A0ABR2ZZ80_9AGAR
MSDGTHAQFLYGHGDIYERETSYPPLGHPAAQHTIQPHFSTGPHPDEDDSQFDNLSNQLNQPFGQSQNSSAPHQSNERLGFRPENSTQSPLSFSAHTNRGDFAPGNRSMTRNLPGAIATPSPSQRLQSSFSVRSIEASPTPTASPRVQHGNVNIHPPSSTPLNSGSFNRPDIWDEYVDGVSAKHSLIGEKLSSLAGFSKVAQHPNPTAADKGTRIDAYALSLKILDKLEKIEKSVSEIPQLKRKVEGLEEKVTNTKFVMLRGIKDEIKGSVELQKKYGLDGGMAMEGQRADILAVIRKIGSGVRDNLRREFLSSLQPRTSKSLEDLTTNCGRKYQHISGTGRINLNYKYRNALVRFFIIKNSEQLHLKEAVTIPIEDEDLGQDDGEGDETSMPPASKRSKMTGGGIGVSAGRTAQSDSFWAHIAAYLKQEQEYYKSGTYTSDEWKDRIQWILAQEGDNMYESLRKGTVVDPRDVQDMEGSAGGQSFPGTAPSQSSGSENLHTLLPGF